MTIRNNYEELLEPYLGRLLFGPLPAEDFDEKYRDEVGEPESEECLETLVVGTKELSVLRGGLVTVCDEKGRWSLYETAARVAERDHLRKWAEFARGRWVKRVPKTPGIFPVRDCAGKLSYRELRLVAGGRLLDVSGSYVPLGKTSEYMGHWWSLPLCSFPDSW